jgi:hypothetical protein
MVENHHHFVFELCYWVECYTDKKTNFPHTYKEIQSGAVAKSYMRKGFLIYEEIRKYFPMYEARRPLVIYDLATAPF